MPFTTNIVSSNPAQREVFSMEDYGIKFVNDLRQVCGFCVWCMLRFPSPIKLTATILLQAVPLL